MGDGKLSVEYESLILNTNKFICIYSKTFFNFLKFPHPFYNISFSFFPFIFFFSFFFFLALPSASESSQARDQTHATKATQAAAVTQIVSFLNYCSRLSARPPLCFPLWPVSWDRRAKVGQLLDGVAHAGSCSP